MCGGIPYNFLIFIILFCGQLQCMIIASQKDSFEASLIRDYYFIERSMLLTVKTARSGKHFANNSKDDDSVFSRATGSFLNCSIKSSK
jgi:hypothetical protein